MEVKKGEEVRVQAEPFEGMARVMEWNRDIVCEQNQRRWEREEGTDSGLPKTAMDKKFEAAESQNTF